MIERLINISSKLANDLWTKIYTFKSIGVSKFKDKSIGVH